MASPAGRSAIPTGAVLVSAKATRRSVARSGRNAELRQAVDAEVARIVEPH
jgi:hypothetical protein